MVRRILLGCGMLSSPLYVAADVLAARRYTGYSYRDQTVSELLAEGAPTRPFMVALLAIPYNVLVAALAAGVWASAGSKRAARITAGLLGGYAAASTAGGLLFPMTPRGTKGARHNVMHIPATAVQSLFLLLSMGSGSTLLGKRFRNYSYGTILTLLVFGALTSLQGPGIARNQPTSWAGIEERINIYATMLWLAVLAGALWREGSAVQDKEVTRST